MSAQTLPASEAAKIKESIESFTRSLENKDFDNWLSYWAEDGVLMPPSHPRVVGREAILGYVRANFGNVRSMTLSNWRIVGESGLGVVTSEVKWTTDEGEPIPSDSIKQMLVLSKDTTGKWLLKIVIFNAGV